ncbi:hypothetical protein [Streptomyces fractus]
MQRGNITPTRVRPSGLPSTPVCAAGRGTLRVAALRATTGA